MNPVIDLTGTGRNDVSWRVEPVNLLGALWVLAADEFVGGKRVDGSFKGAQQKFCEYCKNLISPANRARMDKKTCSDACRQKLSRRNRKEKEAAELKKVKQTKSKSTTRGNHNE